MASVFLSYDREDADKARPVALALEKAAHSVWWDLHIRGGAQFSKVIEEALKAADAVVVLWSKQSVESAWVRDEAAAGRDSGRLIPVSIDGTEPPMGFRQYQTLDLSAGKGRLRSAQLKELLHAIDTMDSREQPAGSANSRPRASERRFSIPLAGVILVVALVAAGLWIWRPWSRSAAAPVVAVQPADGSAGAKAFANDLFVQLGSLQASNADALQLVEERSGTRPDLTFKVAVSSTPQARNASLSLISGRARSLLWSREFDQPTGSLADLKQQVAYTAASVLRCATEALPSDGPKLGPPTLRLYLNGCAGLSLFSTDDPEVLLPGLRRLTQQAPRFEGGWAKLLQAEINAVKHSYRDDPALRESLRSHIAQARRVNPTMAEVYLAEAWLSPPRPIIGWMRFVERAVAANPRHSRAFEERSLGYTNVGRMKDAIRDAEMAVQLDPLSPSARNSLASAYAFAGQLEAAMAELDKAERLWPGAMSVLAARHRIDLRYGDARAALARLRPGKIGSLNRTEEMYFLEARIDRSPAKVERAVREAQVQFKRDPKTFTIFSQSLAEFGRMDELIQILLTADPKQFLGVVAVLFRPQFRSLHDDPRFMAIADRLGLIEYWRQAGVWPDLCYRSDLPYDCKKEAAKVASRGG